MVSWPYSAVLIDLGKFWPFHSIGFLAELPELDLVGKLQCLEEDGNLIRVGTRVVSMENERLDIARHF